LTNTSSETRRHRLAPCAFPATDLRCDYRALAEQIAQRLARRYPGLTARERLVCGYTLAGYTAKGIGRILGIGASTIVTYRRRAYSRLGVSNANQLIAPLLVDLGVNGIGTDRGLGIVAISKQSRDGATLLRASVA